MQDPAEKGKRLFLHSCCAPCSSHVLTYLRGVYRITVFYYNPNITIEEEYLKREAEEIRFINLLNEDCVKNEGNTDSQNGPFAIDIIKADYNPQDYLNAVKGYEDCPERGERCGICFRMRLSETEKQAAKGGFDYYATTLTLSPLKDATLLNAIGEEEGKHYGCKYLPSDFKKKGGYQRSIELSKEYNLYRQDYCGCIFSKAEREKKKENQELTKIF